MNFQEFAVGYFEDRSEVVVTGRWTQRTAEPIRSGMVDRLVLNYALGFEEENLDFLRGLPIRQLVLVDRHLASLEPLESLSDTLELLHLTTDPALEVDLSALPRLHDLSADWHQIRSTIDSANQLDRLHLGRYSEPDLLPLSILRSLEFLALTDRPRLRSLNGLAQMQKLRSLGVYLAASLCDISELAGLPMIEELELEGCRKVDVIDAIAGCTTLRRLNVSECADLASVGPLSRLHNLEVLQLFGSTKIIDGDLSPIASLPKLMELRMQSRRQYHPSVGEIQVRLMPS